MIHNDKTPWLNTLRQEYWHLKTRILHQCSANTINEETFGKVVNKMQNGISPGNDLIVGYWYKHLTFYRHALIHIFGQRFNGQQQLPPWLAKARTQLVPTSEDTNIAKNYRPIACQNLMLKLYTGCINTFLQHHCEINSITSKLVENAMFGDVLNSC